MPRRAEMGWRSGGPHALSDNASQQSCLRPENQHHGKRPTPVLHCPALRLQPKRQRLSHSEVQRTSLFLETY